MSYCRFAEDSDVYVFLSVGGALECCGCSLSDNWSHRSTSAMLAHLREHRRQGHKVPERAMSRLAKEREDNDAFIAAGGRNAA